MSEDYAFTQLARKAGFKIYLCPWFKTQHVGTYAFTGSMQTIANMRVGFQKRTCAEWYDEPVTGTDDDAWVRFTTFSARSLAEGVASWCVERRSACRCLPVGSVVLRGGGVSVVLGAFV